MEQPELVFRHWQPQYTAETIAKTVKIAQPIVKPSVVETLPASLN